MQVTDLDSKPAGYYAYAASRDANMRNIANASHYSQSQKIAADRMSLALALVYAAKDIYVNYRKTFIAVKVNRASVKDRKNLLILEQDYTAKGYKKVVTNQGVTYRIPKQ